MYIPKRRAMHTGKRVPAGEIIFAENQKAFQQRSTPADLNRRILRIFRTQDRTCSALHTVI